jgi:hypothetical protein
MKRIAFLVKAAAVLIAPTYSVCAQTPIVSFDFETASGNSAQNVGSLGSTYNGTAGSEITFGSATSFGVAPTAGSFSYVDPTTFTLTGNYSLTGLGGQIASFAPTTAGGTDLNNTLSINNTAGVTSLFAGAPGLTYSAWVYSPNVTPSQNLFYITRSTANSVRWSVAFGGTPNSTINNQYRTGSTLQNDASGSPTSGQWDFYTATILPASSTGKTTWTTYINGIQVGTGVWTDASTTYPNEISTSGATIGTQTSGAGAFSGYMDNVNLYNTALNAGQVASLYDSYLTASPIPEPGTCALFATGLVAFAVTMRRRK